MAAAALHWRMQATAHAFRGWEVYAAKLRGQRYKVWCLQWLVFNTKVHVADRICKPHNSR